MNNHGLDTDNEIFFYEQDFYVLSNFSSFRLKWKGLDFDTSEHIYHWEKFNYPIEYPDSEKLRTIKDLIRNSRSAHEAFQLAQKFKEARNPDWIYFKVNLMKEILREKAKQHEYVRRKLLQTGDKTLIENSWRDNFWGWGLNRDGENMLGKLWMEIREELRNEKLA